MSKPTGKADPRQARLGAALRENLKRRKAQAKAQVKARAAAGGPDDEPSKPELDTFSDDSPASGQGRALSGDSEDGVGD